MMRSAQMLEFGRKAIWDQDVSALPLWKARLLRGVRTVYVVAQDVLDGDLPLRAMSLVYTTLLSLVPLLAVSFSVLKGFGVHNQIEPLLLQFLAPLGEKGAEISANIIGFVENMKVGLLGSLGLAFLIYTVISLIQKIETALNFTWHTTQTRSLGQRFSEYLSVIMVGPLLMFSAVGLSATVMNHSVVQAIAAIEPFGSLIHGVTQFLPYVLVIAAFTFVYTFVPNTKVHVRSAFVGALVAGVLWESVGFLFASFVASSARYTAMYSGFAIVVLFMMWIYLSWLILLVGGCIAFYHQHPEYLVAERQDVELSSRLKEKLGLMIAFLIGRGHVQGRDPWTLEELTARLGLPMDAISRVVGSLVHGRLLTATGTEPPGYLPSRSLDSIRVIEVVEALRSADENRSLDLARIRAEEPVDQVISGMNRAMRESLEERTLAELVRSGTAG